MRSIFFIHLFCAAVLFSACKSNDVYAEKSKSIDSLGGALNAQSSRFQKDDTLLLSRAVLKFIYYSDFISRNVNDTLTKAEADQLQHFSMAGNRLQLYVKNRGELLNRATLINSQLNNLSIDLKKKNIDEVSLIKYYGVEAGATSELLRQSDEQQELFHTSLEEFKNALNGVEALIRKRNNGELPTIIKDTISL